MYRKFIALFILIALAFGVVTYLKSIRPNTAHTKAPVSSHDRPNTAGTPSGRDTDGANRSSSSTNDSGRKSEIVGFWSHYDKATDYRTAGDYQAAISYYKKALKRDSTHLNTLYYLGNMELATAHYPEADKYWSRLIRLYPESSRGHIQLGTLYSCPANGNSLYDLDRAADYFRKASRINREETGPLLQLAKIDIIRDRYDQALAKLKDVVSSNFMSMEAYFLMGYLHWTAGNTEESKTMFDRALSLHRGDNTAPSNLGEGETESGSALTDSNSGHCSFFSQLIKTSLIDVSKNAAGTANIYREFKSEIESY